MFINDISLILIESVVGFFILKQEIIKVLQVGSSKQSQDLLEKIWSCDTQRSQDDAL